MEHADVVVIGAGPAGLAAAVSLSEHGVDTLVVDEQPAPGGQIFRQPPGTFRVDPGAAPAGAALIARAAAAPGVRWAHGTTAWSVFGVAAEPDAYGGDAGVPAHGPVVALAGAGQLRRVAAERLLLAPGAYDLPVAFPGWTLPGVMAAGGVQAFLKSQRLLPGRRFVLAGAHPLLLVIADQLLGAGAEIAEVALAQPRPSAADGLRALFALRGEASRLGAAAGPALRLRRAGVPLRFSTVVVSAQGTDAVDAAVLARVDRDWRPQPGSERRIACDTLALGYGFVPSSELARQAGCTTVWSGAAGGWVVTHNDWMRSSRERIFVAGEITGIAGAEQAEEEGRLAALGILRALGRLDGPAAGRAAVPVRRRLARARRFSTVVQERFAPRHDALAALADDDTIACRCEEVTTGAIRRALREHPHLGDADAVKQLVRVGMGPCQGRLCGPHVTQTIAAERRRRVEDVGAYTARPPVKPIPLGRLAEAE